jgi:hypothetical protein
MKPSTHRLLQELENHATTHHRRRQIGELLAKIGDPRPGVGLKDGLPDICWLPVTPGGQVRVTRVWEPETPDEQARITHVQYFNVAPLYIAKYLVTHTQYQAFVQAEDGYGDPAWWQGMPEAIQSRELCERIFWNFPRF